MTTDLLKLAYSRFNYLISLTVQEINPYFLNELPSFAIPSQVNYANGSCLSIN